MNGHHIYGMKYDMTGGPKTRCFFITSGYLQDSLVIGSSKLKMFSKIQDLKNFLFFNVFVVRNFYLGVPVPQTWALFHKVKKKGLVRGTGTLG